MADNYLERKMQEHLSQGAKKIIKNPSLDSLIVKNRSYRKFSGPVPSEALSRIISVVSKLSSAKNRQVLRYVIVEGEDAARIEASRGFGKSFIVVCSALAQMDDYAWVDVGIAAQSILLKACEVGYNGIMCMNFDKGLVGEVCGCGAGGADASADGSADGRSGCESLKPVLLIALGVKDQKVQLINLQPGTAAGAQREPRGSGAQGAADGSVTPEALRPYDKDGIHYVPKIHLEDLVIKK